MTIRASGSDVSEVVMATRNASKQSAALAKARERRRELDRERDDQDRLVEEATAEAMVVLEQRGAAEQALAAATGELGEALRGLLGSGVSAERAAALLELDVAEVRRLTKPLASETPSAAAKPAAGAVRALPGADRGEGAARRAG